MAVFFPFESHLKKMGFNLIAGIDEVGIGPLAGPVVCAAVILKENTKLPGLNDSKLVTKKNRERLFKLITEKALDWSITIVSHLVIDDINILGAVRFANYLCVKHLKYKPDFVLIDGIGKQILQVPFQTIIKGDSRVRSIAAASILAKVTRDRIMEYYAKKFDKYGFEEHMGYGTRLHRSNINKYGYCEIHRKSYSLSSLTV